MMNAIFPVYALSSLEPLIPVTQIIPLADLKDFDQNSSLVKKIIISATELSNKNLTYLYGSSDPNNLGMDCSGTIYYLLNQFSGKKLPRSSNNMYLWTKQFGKFYDYSNESKDFSQLKPGDLLFWTGTYSVENKSDITHVMVYVGKDKDNQDLMFGASNGRSYKNKKMWGVSVFDFKKDGGDGHFVGYSCIPYLTCG